MLACFGGAGGQHACAIARALGMRTIVVHRFAGILSAYGIGLSCLVAESQVSQNHHFIGAMWGGVYSCCAPIKWCFVVFCHACHASNHYHPTHTAKFVKLIDYYPEGPYMRYLLSYTRTINAYAYSSPFSLSTHTATSHSLKGVGADNFSTQKWV